MKHMEFIFDKSTLSDNDGLEVHKNRRIYS